MTIKDTKDLQIQALDAYIYELGYTRLSTRALTYYCFKFDKERDAIGFNTAVKLYNSIWHYSNTRKVFEPYFKNVMRSSPSFPISLDPYAYKKLDSRKILTNVFLQAKKNKQIIVQKHQVKFVSPLYYPMFLGDAS